MATMLGIGPFLKFGGFECGLLLLIQLGRNSPSAGYPHITRLTTLHFRPKGASTPRRFSPETPGAVGMQMEDCGVGRESGVLKICLSQGNNPRPMPPTKRPREQSIHEHGQGKKN